MLSANRGARGRFKVALECCRAVGKRVLLHGRAPPAQGNPRAYYKRRPASEFEAKDAPPAAKEYKVVALSGCSLSKETPFFIITTRHHPGDASPRFSDNQNLSR